MMDQIDSRVSSKVEKELDGVSTGLEYEIPRRTCRNAKQTMNDALSNVVNLPAKIPTNDGTIQKRSYQAGDKRLTE